jgi:hypothetical protein
MRCQYAVLVAACITLCVASARADDGMTSFHYLDLYNIEHSVAGMHELQALRADVYVTSTLPGVGPQDITLTMHRASGALEPIQHDWYGHTLLPESAALKTENPLIVTNQPKHTLKASVLIDLLPPPDTELTYTALMLGVNQLNEAIDGRKILALSKLYGQKANGLLLFYNYGDHSLTLHRAQGDEVVKSTSPDKAAAHLKGFDTSVLAPGTQVIYLPLDATTFKANPRVTLDAPPAQTFPAF